MEMHFQYVLLHSGTENDSHESNSVIQFYHSVFVSWTGMMYTIFHTNCASKTPFLTHIQNKKKREQKAT